MSDSAYLIHCTPGRARLKIPSRKGDGAYFANLEAQLHQLADVGQVLCNPAIASVLILHDAVSLDVLQAFAEQRGLFQLEGRQRGETLWELASSGVTVLDRKLQSYTDGNVDTRSVLLLVLLFLLVRQLIRGNVAAPAVSLLWYIFELLAGSKK